MEGNESGLMTVADATTRCRCIMHRISSLPSSNNTSSSSKHTLFKLASSELSFFSALASSDLSSHPVSSNIGHLEAVVYMLQQNFINGVSRVCKAIPLLPVSSVSTIGCGKRRPVKIHVDIVCNFRGKPTWIIVSDRNPTCISWNDSHRRINRVLAAAGSCITLRPSSIVLFFARGVNDIIYRNLEEEFGASEVVMATSFFEPQIIEDVADDGWVYIMVRSFKEAAVFEIKIDGGDGSDSPQHLETRSVYRPCLPMAEATIDLGESFSTLIRGIAVSPSHDDLQLQLMQFGDVNLANLDTTTLIAIVSGISNGVCSKLLTAPTCELRRRFKGNLEFVLNQVSSETRNPVMVELVRSMNGRICFICDAVYSEFSELISLYGGSKEKMRADELLKHVRVVPNNPSTRMMSLSTTRKLGMKNKIIFGTGDYWHAPTLTANMAFVRAVSQVGLSLFTIHHEPRALVGD